MSKYNNKKWKLKRDNILKRDNYKCVECARRNITTQADMVHHINPSDRHPDKFLNNNNLVSLCNKCHNKMHDRNYNTLSALGRKYQKVYNLRTEGKALTKIVFVVGPPCSGKSTYVKEHMGNNDIVFDYDTIAQAMTECQIHDNNPNLQKYMNQYRKIFLQMLETETDFDTAWIVTTKMYDYYYDYILLDPQIIYMNATKEECLERLYNNPEGRNIKEIECVIQEFFDGKE